jgi:hypothetical protein
MVKFSELAGLPLIVPSSTGFNRKVLEAEAAAIGVRLNIVAEVNGANLFAPLLLSGEAYLLGCVGSERYTGVTPLGLEVQAGRLQTSLVVEPSFPRVVVISTSGRPSRSVQVVTQYIIDKTRQTSAPVK